MSLPKKRKVENEQNKSVAPVRVDAFETEQKREVAASAGLQAVPKEPGQVVLSHQVRHQVAVPAGYNYIPLSQHVPPDPPARTYPFTLDPFQQTAIASIERNESVLVSAHTSAGKTVVAEYAIAQALKDQQRVIYTSPIKALSNQKYRELLEDFGDVGLMTGDVTINPNSSCLVMTTEILRSMLYRGSEIMREVAWVIFDEIHYMRDKERGVVWEETIILLPQSVRYVFLSATIPNAMQFAEWICKIHDQPCHIVYTNFRPTPLQHYLFPAGGDGIHLVVDENSTFREDNFQRAMGVLAEGRGEDPSNPNSGKNRKGKTKKGGSKGTPDIYKIVKMIIQKNYNPVIVFAFSKKETEALALQMAKLEFNTEEESTMISDIFQKAIFGLSEDDKSLPQIKHILPLLRRGIGIHHGGLLPILKEVIEIMFQEGLIKVLFATETFSIGLNMPAKTVVFTNVRKFDGKDFRNLSSGEYIQMSGRAGRRGLDDRGIVIMMCDEKLEPASAKNMVKGEADRLDSAFHLGYNMILNLLRVEGVNPEFMLKNCFYQFQNTTSVPLLEDELRSLEDQKSAITIPDEEDAADYYELREVLDGLNHDLRDVIHHPTYALPFLQAGRLVRVKHEDKDFGWGAVVNFEKRVGARGKPLDESIPPQEQYIVDVLLHVSSGSVVEKNGRRTDIESLVSKMEPCAKGETGDFAVIPVLLSTLDGISHIRLILPKDLRPPEARAQALKSLQEVMKRFPNGLSFLDPVETMGIEDNAFKDLIQKIEALEKRLKENPLYNSPKEKEVYDLYAKKNDFTKQIRETKRKLAAAHSVLQLDELKNRKRVLRKLEFVDENDVVTSKGRVACEISSGDELLLTQLVYDDVFKNLTPEQTASLLSCFVFTEKSESKPNVKGELSEALRSMQTAAKHIGNIVAECKIPIDVEEYVASFKIALMDPVYKWCQGANFSEITKLSDVFEGSLIRCFRRLLELLRQMSMAAQAIGNEELKAKFEEALKKLERQSSVVFNPSLYL